MICNNCGTAIPDDSLFCENCGTPLEPVGTTDEMEGAVDGPVEEIYEEPIEEAYDEPVEEAYKEPVDEVYNEPAEEAYEGPAVEVYDEPAEEPYEEPEYEEEAVEVPIEEIAESDEFREIEELEAIEVIEEPEVYDDIEEDYGDEFKEIDELEAMDEVEYDEDEYEYDDRYENDEENEEEYDEYDEEIEEEPVLRSELPEKAELPDLSELEFEETGQPEGSEAEWLESFQQLAPKAEDWPEEPVEEEVIEELIEEEVYEEPQFEGEPIVDEPMEEQILEEPAEEVIEEPATEEVSEEPTEEVTEEPAAYDEPAADEELKDSKVEEAKEAISDGAEKVGAWLGNLGKSVHTGTGWAVDVAKEKASKLKDEKKSNRNQWTEEDEGELDLGYNFWYRSNQADTSSRYEGMEEEEEPEPEKKKIDDATTYVAVKSNPSETKKTDKDAEESGEASDGEQPPKKKVNKLKVTVIIMVIAALLGAGGIFGSKSYTENKQEEAYKASLTKAEQSVEARDYAAAEEIYRGLISEYPDRAELYEALANAYIADEKYDDARNTINEGVARTGKSKTFTALAADLDALTSTDWQEPFRRVLADNEWAARSYEDENGSCVALCDITGDKKPEMIYFTQEYYGYGVLHLCVYENDKVEELSYECKNRGTQYQDAFYDVEEDDSGYVVYKSKTSGKFGIYESIKRGVEAWQTTNKYTISGTECDRDEVVEACIETSYRVSEEDADDVSDNDYYKNDKKIKYNDYLNEFKAILDDIDKVIITSENPAGDKEIWNRIMDMDEEAMTYDGAMKILDEDAQ